MRLRTSAAPCARVRRQNCVVFRPKFARFCVQFFKFSHASGHKRTHRPIQKAKASLRGCNTTWAAFVELCGVVCRAVCRKTSDFLLKSQNLVSMKSAQILRATRAQRLQKLQRTSRCVQHGAGHIELAFLRFLRGLRRFSTEIAQFCVRKSREFCVEKIENQRPSGRRRTRETRKTYKNFFHARCTRCAASAELCGAFEPRIPRQKRAVFG